MRSTSEERDSESSSLIQTKYPDTHVGSSNFHFFLFDSHDNPEAKNLVLGYQIEGQLDHYGLLRCGDLGRCLRGLRRRLCLCEGSYRDLEN